MQNLIRTEGLGDVKSSDRLRINNQDLLKGKIEKAGCSVNRVGSVKDYYNGLFARSFKIRSPTMDGLSASLEAVDFQDALQKAALTTGDAGAVNATYTMGAFIYYATRRNLYGVLPKVPWDEMGFRAVTTASKTSGIGIADGQTLGTGVERTYVEVGPTVKEWELVSDYSTRLGIRADISDAVTLEQDRVGHEADFFRSFNADLFTDSNTLASNNAESIDRVVASYSEMTGSGYDADDMDIYSQDRDASTAFDAYVSHGSTTDRTLTTTLINNLFTNTYDYWEEQSVANKVYITGMDTLQRWGELESAKQRFVDNVPAQITVGDGIRTVPGADTGFLVSTYQGIPIVPDTNTPQDTISRIYLLDLDNVNLMFGIPPAFYDSDDMFQVGHLTKGVWYGAGELYAKKFKPHGKLRDLS